MREFGYFFIQQVTEVRVDKNIYAEQMSMNVPLWIAGCTCVNFFQEVPYEN